MSRYTHAFAALSAISFLALIAAAPALAATLETPSRIDMVTVYPDAAQITRVTEVELPAGATSIVFKGLPMTLDPASIRVEGAGGAAIQIGSVESRVTPAPPQTENPLGEKLRALNTDRALMQARLAAVDLKKTMIERYAQSSPEKLGAAAAPLEIEKWSGAWEAVGDGLARTGEEIHKLRQQIADIEQEIRTVQASNRTPAARTQPSREVTVDIETASAAKSRLVLIYRVAGAGWQPGYDARLESKGAAKPLLHLVRRAQVVQRTGEDWSNIELSVSTVRAQRGTQAPEVLTQRVKLFEPPLRPVARSQMPGSRDNALAMTAAAPAPKLTESDREERARESESTLEAGTYEAQFRVPGRIDVPGDGSSRSLRLGSQTIEPTLIVKTSPSIDATAYLEVSFVNKEDAPILPGIVNIQRDGMFVGRGAFRMIAPGEDAKLGLGADDRIKVTRVPLSRRENTPGWIGATRTERQDYRTTIRNLHPFAVKVSVIDRIPVSEDTAIAVEPLATNTVATDKAIEDRRGVMGWTFDLAPEASREIRLGWQLRWPKEKQVVTENLPGEAR